jgi:ribosomal protein L11 methylase PrmA
MPQFAEQLRAGGHCICSGCLLDDASAMRQAARAQGFAVANERSSLPWWAVHLTRAAA